MRPLRYLNGRTPSPVPAEARQDEVAADEFWERVPQELHEDGVRRYLGSNGDAIDARVAKLVAMAEGLLAAKFPGPSVVASVTALEVMIQHFCIRPIIEGAILSDLLAHEITKRIVGSRSSDQRSLLAPILRPWGIELERTLLPNGKPLWSEFQTVVVKKRDGFVHRGDDVSEEVAALAIGSTKSFRTQIVMGIAKRLGFTNEKTGCWSRVDHRATEGVILGGTLIGGETKYGTTDPFS
jgi:hypothetical protein